ncbi:sulfatase family protein [Pontiella sulfatireligans]|uniref:Arylsulfatase n=1 Tax=Pontiella sulfatireligans TaxID=2750658 RepID=A0A6C2UH11_9BACT|nr:arylsulfatase [Pontiella sulfatireligans]SPS74225.1 sulfatase S1_15 [Kiritimatiellales bacterium]VGO18701.1 Arylsulfatase [Pontiella sulfatireligans]
MNTRKEIRAFTVVLWAVASLVHAAVEGLPSIVYIICDDLGYGEIHALNPDRSKVPTPHVDKLASQGMVFTDAHSGSSVCTPTRYGVLTGRYAWRTRLQNGVVHHNGTPMIAEDRLTVPALLKRSGYHTVAIGKWHLVYNFVDEGGERVQGSKKKKWNAGMPVGTRVEDSPITRGFDYYIGFHHSAIIETFVENDRVIADKPKNEVLEFLGNRAVNYIGEQAGTDNPFFLYLALNSPHTPIAPSKDWIGKSGMGDYCDFLMETDDVVGRVLQALEDRGMADNTLVFFTSDNGCSAGPAHAADLIKKYGHYPSAHLRGYKSDGWDGGHRVPFVVRWPGKVKAGSTNQELVCHTDMLATCAQLTGQKLAANEGEDSVSILPVLLGKNTKPVHDAVVHHSINGKFSIRQGKWKLCLHPGSGGWSGPKDAAARKEGLPEYQLYDMEKDIGETTNLAGQHPEKVEQLLTLLKKQVADGRSTPGTSQHNDVGIDVFKKDK